MFKRVLITILFLLSYLPAYADTEVIMIGQGISKHDAIQDALRKAVDSATGIFLYAETEVNNYILVKDKIISASKGYVKSYETISESDTDGFYHIKMSIIVDDSNIKSEINKNVKTVSINDALKDYSKVVNLLDRNKKYAEILSFLSSKPVNELYLLDYVGYEVKDAGIKSATVILKFRIALNKIVWNTYYDALKQIRSESKDNFVVINYKLAEKHKEYFQVIGEKLYIHKDFADYTLKPKQVKLQYEILDKKYSIKPFILEDNLIRKGGNEHRRKYIPKANTFTSLIINNDSLKSSNLFINDDGYEYKIKHIINNIEDIKLLSSIKVKLVSED